MTSLAFRPRTASGRSLLPGDEPLALIDAAGHATAQLELSMPDAAVLLEIYRRVVTGRCFDTQAPALTKQGRLVYTSSRGQEACQVGAVLAMREQDWLFPTYRDSVAIVTRSVDRVEVHVDQVVVEVETAKAAVEVPISFGGKVSALHAQAGQTLAVGAP